MLVLAIVGGGYALLGAMSAPEDLGVRASEADFDAAVAKAHVDWPELPPGADPADFERVYIGVQPMDVMLTEAELSALMSYRHDPSYWPLSNVQVDLTGPDTARMSAVVTYAGRDWPVYVEGSGGFSGSALFADISAARVGAISVPESFLPTGSDALEAMINDRLARIPGLDVETLDVTAQGVHAIGTIWQTAEYVPVG